MGIRRIVFLGNCHKTYFWSEIARRLELKGYTIDWILVNRSQVEDIRSKFVSSKVLYLPLSLGSSGEVGNFKLNDLVYRDRRLRFIREEGLRYLSNIQQPLKEFLLGGENALVVGELTYGYEVVTHRIVNSLDGYYWCSPFSTRSPQGKFSFFCNEYFSREIGISYSRLANKPKDELVAADYVAMNMNHVKDMGSLAYIVRKIGTFIKNTGYDRDDPTWFSNSRRDKIIKNGVWLLNRWSYKLVHRQFVSDLDKSKRYILFPLHLEPELNIDTCGRYWENQFETILKIWRQLSPNDVLLVKEHPVAIGNRGFFWFRRLKQFPNIKIVHEGQDVKTLLDFVEYVFTISGTMGLEAALRGKKVLCLGSTVYDRLENVTRVGITDFSMSDNIDDLYHNHGVDTPKLTLGQFTALIEERSFFGDPEGDTVSNPNVYAESNIGLVAGAFDSVCRELG
jgi:hypothetical protein